MIFLNKWEEIVITLKLINKNCKVRIWKEEKKNLKGLMRELRKKMCKNIFPVIRACKTIRIIEVLHSFIDYLVDERLRKSSLIV